MVLDSPDRRPESEPFGEPSRPTVPVKERLQPVEQMPEPGLGSRHLADLLGSPILAQRIISRIWAALEPSARTGNDSARTQIYRPTVGPVPPAGPFRTAYPVGTHLAISP
jgi:hypothetical protein